VRIGDLAESIRTNFRYRLDSDLIAWAIVLVIVAALGGPIRYERHVVAHAEQNKRVEARAELSELSEHLNRYYKDFGNFPTTEQGLDFLLGSDELDSGILRGPLPQRLPLLRDPWGRPFKYESDGNSYFLKSLGPTGHDNDPDLTISVAP